MIKLIMLDSSPLGLAAQRPDKPDALACRDWAFACAAKGVDVCISEIADYEIRRELLRAKVGKGIERLDSLKDTLRYVPITTVAINRAAALWAKARNEGIPTAHPQALDGDVIVAAQALIEAEAQGLQPDEFVIATINVRHLARYANAALWQDITV